MPDPLVSLDTDRIAVDPGGQARISITVTNPGTRVEGYDLDVVGEQPIDWAEVIPPTVSVYPQQSEQATVVFSPAAGPGTQGGEIVFGVRARSRLDPTSSAVAEGTVEVKRVFGLQGQLTPVTSSGRWRGHHTITVHNWGNAPARLRLVASDPEEALGFLVRPDVIEVPVGGSASAIVKVRTRAPMLRGQVTRHAFQVACEPADEGEAADAQTAPTPGVSTPDRPLLDGAMSQKPILSRAVVAAGLGAVAVLAAGTAYALTRPGAEQEDFAELGRPDAPTDLEVVSVEATSVTLEWTGVRQVQEYEVQTLNPESKKVSGTERLSGTQEEFTVTDLSPSTEYCFAVVALRGDGDLVSPQSNDDCGRTAEATPTDEPTDTAAPTGPEEGPSAGGDGGGNGDPTDQPTPTTPPPSSPDVLGLEPGDWVAPFYSVPANSSGAKATISRILDSLVGAGVDAQVLDSADYPDLDEQLVQSSLIIVIDKADTREEAIAVCRAVPTIEDPLAGFFCSGGAYQPILSGGE
jgi:hypothetical protein